MKAFVDRLKQRKVVQWAIAYVAFWFALLQGVDIVATRFNWPDAIERYFILALAIGFCVTLVLVWYHGERGAQRVGSMEIMILALLLAIGGVLIWRFGPAAIQPRHALARSPDAAQRLRLQGMQTRTAEPARRVSDRDVANQSGAATQNSAAVAVASGLHAVAATAIAQQPIPAKSIAVLPFENLSNDKNNEYFVAGMQDLILTKLADIGDLKVISRTSTMKYASHPDDLKTIGQQLGVATILEGSVQKAGDQVLINVQLIDAKTDSHIWAQAYTRKLDNIFGVEGDVAEKIAVALKAKLSASETTQLAAVPTTNQAAYDLFLRAEFQAKRGDINTDTASYKAALLLYRQAIPKDPNFALAWARLSYAESALAWFGGGGENVKQLTAQARSDAEQALKLAPNLAASQIALGYSDYWGNANYAAALKAFDAALALRPNDADALAARGYVERRQGRFDTAIASLQQALAHDPRNSGLAYNFGETYMIVSHYADAERLFQRALALDPNNLNAKLHYSLAVLLRSGDVARALAAAQGDAPVLKLQRVGLLVYQRRYREALTLLDGIPDTPDNFNPDSTPRAWQQAELYRRMGDMAHAKPLFEQALPEIRAQLAQQQGINLAAFWEGIASAKLGLGHTAAGLEAIAKAQAILAKAKDQVSSPMVMVISANLYAEADRSDLAVPLLAKALATPGIGGNYSPVLLWLDPGWDPIRHDPRFQALLKKYAKYKPAVTYDSPPASAASTK